MLNALLQMLGVASADRSVRPRRQDTGPSALESLEARLLLEGNPILSVDFGAAGAETGFVEQSTTNFTHSTTAGDLTVDLSGIQGLFNYATTGTNDDLYRDFYFKNGGTITMTLSGVAVSPNTDYDLTFWSYYGAEGRNTTFAPADDTAGPSLGPIAISNTPAPSALLDPLYSIAGTYTSDDSGMLTIAVGSTSNRPAINGISIATDDVPDTTAPTLLPVNIVDDQSGGPVNENTLVTYTVAFSEDIDESTVDASDFGNAGTAPISLGAITETTPGVFTVEVTPTAAGTLELQVPAEASILDTSGLSLDTASAIVDDTSINVVVAPPDNIAPSPNPMSFATAPYASSDTSIAMVATAATDDAGVEYYFTETSDNPGGDDSGWQTGTTYEDTGLTTGLVYTYTVKARDLSANQNATAPSDPASASATAQTSFVLSVDFGTAGVEPGFVGQTTYIATHSTTAGDITVTVAGDPQGFYVYAGGGTNPALFDDFIFDNSGPFTMTLSGIGIAASTDYDMTFWSYYGAQARDTKIYAASGTTGTTLGPIAFNNPTTMLSDNSASGTFTSDSSGNLTFSLGDGRPAINGFTITPNGPDTRPPALLPGNIIDDQNGGPVNENTLVTYTVAFSEDIDESTVDASDFGNAGSASISFGTISETSPGMFTVGVTPTSAGTLQLQIPVGASIMDAAGLSLDTASAIVDDTTINVVVAPPDTIAPSPNPMTFATVPYASSETSIAMVAAVATDVAGVEYYFTETSGNPGGGDSGWQANVTYEDTGLTTGLVYTYTVAARDLSANHNATAPSDPASATAQTPIVPPTITTPTTRHIVQRSATTNLGAIEIEGTYSVGVPDRIEARAVVMTGSGNNGTTTAWQTIDAAPSGGSYSGTLTDVPAGGWYQLEVRCVIGDTPSNAAVLGKVGVGDIYVTAGQSNAANFAANQAPQDDRISARTSTTGSTWTLATAPLPISNGGGGSVWTWLANKLIAAEDIPIGLVSLGIGGSPASSWTPGGGNYNNLLKPAVQSLPANGFRAALWHQGETDSIGGVSAATHSGYLNGMVSQSRIDAGWDIPWYLAEVSYHPSSNISAQEPIAAGQRMTISGDPLTFFGPSTDELHLTGGGSLHFNAVGTNAHAQGWSDILGGNVTITPINGDFEEHGWLEYAAPYDTSPTPLADGASTIIDIVTTGLQLRVLDWRILTASGVNAADGSNGFYNPTTGTYAGAVDTVNGGVLPNMDGKHVAMLDGGAADNYFLQSTRVSAEADTIYTLTVALGVRDNPATFGDARIEITADGAVVASASFDKAALDALHGSDASGTFTDASISWTTGGTVAANQSLAFRIVKEDGAGTVLDFDNVRFTAAAAPLKGDFDGDGDVDAGDYIVLKRNFGTTSNATTAMGDADGDGDVDWNDLQLLKTYYGSVAATPTPAIPTVSDRGIATVAETPLASQTVLSSAMPAMTASIEADDINRAQAAAALEATDPLRTLSQVRQRDRAALPLATPTPRRIQFNAMPNRIRRIQFPRESACAALAPQDAMMSSIAETPNDIDADYMDVLSLSKVLRLGSDGLNDVQGPFQRR